MACTEKDLYKSVLKCPGTLIAPGIRPYFYFILKSNIVGWPKLADEATAGMGDLAVLKTNFTLASDKKWHRLDLVDLKSNTSSETQGEMPSATHLNKAELVAGGTDEEITGFGRMAINDSLVYLIPDRNGKFRLYGNESFDVKTTVAQASGTAVTDAKQTTIAIEVPDFCPAPFYQGKIETADNGDISGLDGSAVSDDLGG